MVETTLKDIMNKLEKIESEISYLKGILSKEKAEMQNTQTSQEKMRKESLMEFFRKYNPKKDTDKSLVIMRFLEVNREMNNITSKSIIEGFREVREKPPQNVADKIQALHKKGFVMPGEIVENLKGWVITRSGLNYLEELKK